MKLFSGGQVMSSHVQADSCDEPRCFDCGSNSELNENGLCSFCQRQLDEALKDREFDEKVALGYI